MHGDTPQKYRAAMTISYYFIQNSNTIISVITHQSSINAAREMLHRLSNSRCVKFMGTKVPTNKVH